MRIIVTALALGLGSAQAQTPTPHPEGLQLPDTGTPMASSAGTTSRNEFGLWKCVTGPTITCYGVYTRKQKGEPGEYTWTRDYWTKWKMFDNFHIEHAATRGYYVNGRGKQQASVTLGPDEAIWFAIEFVNGADDITKASVIVPDDRGYGKLQLTAPVVKSLD